MSESDLIEDYLDRFVELLDGPGDEIRRALAEAEDHLRLAEAQAVESGMNPLHAAESAVERFGTPENVAQRYGLMRKLATPGQIVLQALMSLMLVGSFVLIAIGLSGVLAAGASALFGPEFIAGDGPGVTYTADRCADFLGFFPDAKNCAEAAVLHHLDETIGFRIDAGILGLLAIVAWWFIRRSIRSKTGPPAIPDIFVPSAATALFAAAAVLLGGLGTIEMVTTGMESGAGYFVTAGVVSLIAALGFGIWLFQRLQTGSRRGSAA